MHLLGVPLPDPGNREALPWGTGLLSAPLPQKEWIGRPVAVDVGRRRGATAPAPSARSAVGSAGGVALAQQSTLAFAPLPDDVLPATISPTAMSTRTELREKAEAILRSGWEASTVRTYSRALKVHVHGVEQEVDASLLPVDSPEKLMLLFASMDGANWNTIRANKAAVRAWHQTQNLSSVFEQCWDDRTLHFWRGLKKRASHSSDRKRAITASEWAEFAYVRQVSNTPAGLRDAAMATFCFFGVRRISEAINIRAADVTVEDDSIACFIRSQKNDPCGVGQWCWIPFTTVESTSPGQIVQDWISWRQSHATDAVHFFCTTTGSKRGPVSADSWRKTIHAHFNDPAASSHSFRRGGTEWGMHVARLPPDVVQSQGGWKSAEVMLGTYANTTPETQKKRLLEGIEKFAGRPSKRHAVRAVSPPKRAAAKLQKVDV